MKSSFFLAINKLCPKYFPINGRALFFGLTSRQCYKTQRYCIHFLITLFCMHLHKLVPVLCMCLCVHMWCLHVCEFRFITTKLIIDWFDCERWLCMLKIKFLFYDLLRFFFWGEEYFSCFGPYNEKYAHSLMYPADTSNKETKDQSTPEIITRCKTFDVINVLLNCLT